jgi:thiol-disulfide isomerase/thioredoxin
MGKTKIWMILAIFSMLICNFNIISASEESDVESERSEIFGGIIIDPNENFNNSIYTKDSPSIAHIFTATWCTPCVEVEHAIEDVANETDVVMLTFHRFAGETEDPFGSENAENWWKEWFNENLPLQPTAIINGGDSLIGASQGSYNNLYAKAIEKPDLESSNQTEFSMIHTSFDSNSSEFTWEVVDVNGCDDVKTFVNFVEDVAYFPNGSNGLDNYTHIVHNVKEIPGGSGTTDLSQGLSEINAYDGDDLNLVITFSCIKSSDSGPDEGIKPTDEDSSSRLSHIGLIPTIITIVATSMIISRRNSLEGTN